MNTAEIAPELECIIRRALAVTAMIDLGRYLVSIAAEARA